MVVVAVVVTEAVVAVIAVVFVATVVVVVDIQTILPAGRERVKQARTPASTIGVTRAE